MSAFLVEQNYQSWRETDVSAGSAGIRQRKPIQKTSNLRSKQFSIVVKILITSYYEETPYPFGFGVSSFLKLFVHP
ncbi:hypothetical protein [Neobacillus niacini]|uniref:hypothetical protein n=1 Tax=Neobacillus niacini TaxID=86668 RepID=UPI002FFE3927